MIMRLHESLKAIQKPLIFIVKARISRNINPNRILSLSQRRRRNEMPALLA